MTHRGVSRPLYFVSRSLGFCRLWIVAFLGSAALTAQTGSGSIQGKVTDASSNKPIAGAFVIAIRSGLPPVSQIAQTGVDGSYQLQSLPAGAYSLCVQVLGDGYLDPCRFGSPAQPITLMAGQQSAGNVTKLKPASILKVRLNDASGLLAQLTKDGHAPDLLIGVFGSGAQRTFYPAHLAGRDKTGSDYQVAIPLDTPLNLSVASGTLTLADAAGSALPNSASQQGFQHSTGDPNPPSFVFMVTGVKP
jgi:Carboxypeptidase regulatory-like domain